MKNDSGDDGHAWRFLTNYAHVLVCISADPGAPTLHAQAQSRKAELKDGVRADPLVQAVLTRFPGAEIVDVRPPAGEPSALDETPFDAPGEPGRADDEP